MVIQIEDQVERIYMPRLETVKIITDDGFKIINKSDFDEKKDKKLTAAMEAKLAKSAKKKEE